MTRAYILPPGNVQIAFSGGRTSAYMLHNIMEANGGLPDTARVVFSNTGREMPATLDFVQEVGQRWNVPITWLEYRPTKPWFETVSHNSASRDGEPFAALIAKRKALPNQDQRFCSAELKTLTAKRYLVSIGWKRWASAIGFRADEPTRTPRIDNRITGWTPLRPANVTKADVARFWHRQPFDLRLPIIKGKTIGGNCDGCFLKSEEYLARLSVYHPARAAWWDQIEQTAGHTFSSRFSRAELRRSMERQPELKLSTVGYLCQADGGECT